MPAPEQRPAIAAPKLIEPPTYNCVSITDTAQFGIRPTSAVIKGCAKLPLNKIAERRSFPSRPIRSPRTIFTASIKTEILRVWRSAGLNIPPSSSQPQREHISIGCFLIFISRNAISIAKPNKIPIRSLKRMSFHTAPYDSGEERRIGTASSEVEINTDIKVPSVITPAV